jgi:hypothetical protein
MSRPVTVLGQLITAALAAVALVSGAAAAEPPAAGPAEQVGATPSVSTDEAEAIDPCAIHQRLTGHDCALGGSPSTERDPNADDPQSLAPVDDRQAVDPCALQERMTGRGCDSTDRRLERSSLAYDGADGYSRTVEFEAIDPCAMQYRMTGRGCTPGGPEYPPGMTYYVPGGSVWRAERSYSYAAAPVRDGSSPDHRSAGGCFAMRAWSSDCCLYRCRESNFEPMRLPADFFVGDGGVGGGIVDYGGGGEGFFLADGFRSVGPFGPGRARFFGIGHGHMRRTMHHGCGCGR